MIKLFVDDLRPTPSGWVGVKTVTEAIRLLATREIGEVSLDHDIMHTVPANQPFLPIPHNPIQIRNFHIACAETYEPVAWFIAFCPFGVKRVTIHTANSVGAERIANIFEQVKGHGVEVVRRMHTA